MMHPQSVTICPYCSSNIKEVQFNFDAKLITCNNKQCTFPFQEVNFEDYVILMDHRIMTKKPIKKLNYQPNRPPLYITESTMASIREELPDLEIPKEFQFATPLPKLSFFQNGFYAFGETMEEGIQGKADLLNELVTMPMDSATSETTSPDSIYSLVNLA
ncbi:hypothetical protein K502DRAFT_362516 [Neoconidiobolus thromboides FSU 785]|nr:hypothetical protein K502DRAFT_362516 [Neoconidiobolus thromboides FSU 785]